ncbi:MAG: molybdopterin-dependent oxidoreductase, partial [bacterium]|nr:molybdopterin-dependent oxidoreductase [bacterium]
PMNCTANVRNDGCDIWAPTQNQDGARDIAAKMTNLPHEKINIHTPFLGGGYL